MKALAGQQKKLPASLLFILFIMCFVPGISGAGSTESRTITDMAGRKVIIPGAVNKIVTTFKPATLCVFALGLQDKIVGIDTSSKREPLFNAVYPPTAKLTPVGSKTKGINCETVVALKPDLVILYAQKDGIALAGRLESMGIVSIIILPENFDSVTKTLRTIADAVGDPELAKNAEDTMNFALDTVNKTISSIPVEKRKTAYFASSIGLFSTASGNMLQNEIFVKGGVVNVAGALRGYFQDVSPEQFVLWNPDIIFFSKNFRRNGAKRLNQPEFKSINAVATQQVYKFPSSLSPWDFPSPLSALGALWVAKKAYPDLFRDLDLHKSIDKFHKDLFGKTFSEMGGKLNDRVY